MIGSLRGVITEIQEESAILEVQGVGYEVLLSNRALMDLQADKDRLANKGPAANETKLLIYTHVREDQLHLFGFLTQQDKNLFLSLLKVNGIGPKSALTLMSGASTEQIEEWINNGDAKALAALPKIGKKTAEQMILTLKGKLVVIEAPVKVEGPAPLSHEKKAIASALMNLGFKPQKVEEFVRELKADVTLEEGVRKGLKALAQSVELGNNLSF